MNRRNALMGLAAGPIAGGVLFAQGGVNGGQPGSNLRAFILNTSGLAAGTFDIKRFAAIDSALHAVGIVTLTDGVKTAVSTLAVPVTATSLAQSGVAQQQASCPILHLAIGPINLDLLGLVVTTLPTVVDIVAVPGPGNLLGNLLCAIAGLLDAGGPLQGILTQLVALLNQLLGALS